LEEQSPKEEEKEGEEKLGRPKTTAEHGEWCLIQTLKALQQNDKQIYKILKRKNRLKEVDIDYLEKCVSKRNIKGLRKILELDTKLWKAKSAGIKLDRYAPPNSSVYKKQKE
jgi:hypothetical protein